MRKKKNIKAQDDKSWIIKTIIMAFILSLVFSVTSQSVMANANLFFSVIILLIIIFVGVIFDMVGVAVAKAEEKPFHSMASNKIKSAHYSLMLIKNAGQVATFCNDVIGDIAGVISGTAITIIVINIMNFNISFINRTVISVIISALVASMIIGGKAMGKDFALKHAKNIVKWVGKAMYQIDKRIGYKILNRVKR